MKTCEEITLLVASEDYRKLSRRDKIAARFHLMMCKACKDFKADSKLINAALKEKFRNTPTYHFSSLEKESLLERLSKENR